MLTHKRGQGSRKYAGGKNVCGKLISGQNVLVFVNLPIRRVILDLLKSEKEKAYSRFVIAAGSVFIVGSLLQFRTVVQLKL